MKSEHKKRKLLTDFYMWMLENDYDHNIRIRVENKAELFIREQHEINTCVIPVVINWVAYSFEKEETRPPKPDKYLIYRKGCNKMHFEMWNGNGWASSNGDCTHWAIVDEPCL